MNYWTDEQLASIHKMLNPRSIAVVGATERMQYGGRFLRSVMAAQDRLNVYPVNPRYDQLMGVPCYPSVSDLPESPDTVGVIVPYHRVIPVLRESADKGAGSAIVISAGFSERGIEERRQLQRELGDLARTSGVRISGPNCLGLANVKDDIWACSSSSLSGMNLKSGNVGLVCQSGASAFGPFLSRAIGRGIGYSYIVSTGNEADLEAPDFARYLLDDDDTRVIAMFIEGFKDAAKFLEVARMAAERGKPIVAVKIGRSNAGTRAAQSHTAALTGSDDAWEAAFRQYGVTRVHDWDKLLEVAQLLADSPPARRRGVALVSHSGGVCSLTADNLGEAGIELPELSDSARDGINDILEGFGWAANPADITGHASRDTVAQIMSHMMSESEVGALVVASSAGDEQARHVIQTRDDHPDKLVTFLYTGNELGASGGLEILKDARVPVFHSPQNLASAIRQLHDYHAWREDKLESGFAPVREMTPEQHAIAADLRAADSPTLTESEAKRVLAAWGIPVTDERTAATADEAAIAAAEIGYPVVLKIESPDILHKTEAGGIELGIADETELRAAYGRIMTGARAYAPDARLNGVLVQPMITGGVETIIGVSRDSQLGPILLYGIGGIFVEALRDVALRVCPITHADARQMIAEVSGSRLLEGFRGTPKSDTEALADALVNTSQMAAQLPDLIQELDINPLTVLPDGQGAQALDALLTLRM